MKDEDVKQLLENYDEQKILAAAERIRITRKLGDIFKGSRWLETPIIFDTQEFMLPASELERRPLAVTFHTYGLWIEPIYTNFNGAGKPEYDFALHIDESDDGLHIYVEDSFSLTLTGSHELGFTIKTNLEKNTKIETEPIVTSESSKNCSVKE